MSIEFPYPRLHAYQTATALLATVDILAATLPRGHADLAGRLRRAASSIQANIAEGAGELAAPEKARFYRLALRSATECGALVDQCREVMRSDDDAAYEASVLLDRVVAMTTRLVQRFGGSESGSG